MSTWACLETLNGSVARKRDSRCDEMAQIFIMFCFITSCAGFSVSAPAGHVVGIRDHSVVLGCNFTIGSESEILDLAVTWQRVEDSRVVHSFYYQQDQLETQDAAYHNRTALFVSELMKGNASVRIDRVGPRDAGDYLCTVSSSKGTDKAKVKLDIGAFYTEPSLSIHMNCSSITVTYTTEGYPEPEVKWLGEDGQTLNYDRELTEEKDGADRPLGLFHLKSSHVSEHTVLNVSFTLKNQLINQDLHRTVTIRSEGRPQCGVNPAIVCLSVLCFLLFLGTASMLIVSWRKKRQYSQVPTNSSQPMSESTTHRNGTVMECGENHPACSL